MKRYDIFFRSIFDNYNPKNYEYDFLKTKTQNIVCIISSDLKMKDILKLSKLVSKFINNTYFTGNLILFAWDEKLISSFMEQIKNKHHYSKFEIIINLSRKSKITCLSKIVELKIVNVLFIIPSYEKQLFINYLQHLKYSNTYFLCTKTYFLKTVKNSYRNFKIINSLKPTK